MQDNQQILWPAKDQLRCWYLGSQETEATAKTGKPHGPAQKWLLRVPGFNEELQPPFRSKSIFCWPESFD